MEKTLEDIMLEKTRTIHIPLSIHTKMKVQASKEGMKLREYLIKILDETLKENK